MLGRSKSAPIDKIETVIGPNTNFRGRLVCDGSIRIDGVCEEGVIETLGNIVIGPQAKVAADLIAENVSVSGAVTGNIKAAGRLEILSTGKVWGNVDVGSFLLDEEGYFRGSLAMKDEPEPPDFSSISTEEEVILLDTAEEIEPQPAEAKTE
ncbi:MAG: polymer-forming cytoskeletal protein [Anaerolineales bacterium]|nr:polymer-forming cytoskeletal protein [Anaerolineales bacterium]